MALAHNTFLELVRQKVFYFLLLFALLIIGSSLFTVEFSFQSPLQVLKDVGLGAMSIFSWLLGLLCTAMLLPKDIEDRTLYTILAKPVPRFEYITGKLLGVFMMIGLAVVLMSVLFAAVLGIREQQEIAEIARITPVEELEAAVAAVRASISTSACDSKPFTASSAPLPCSSGNHSSVPSWSKRATYSVPSSSKSRFAARSVGVYCCRETHL